MHFRVVLRGIGGHDRRAPRVAEQAHRLEVAAILRTGVTRAQQYRRCPDQPARQGSAGHTRGYALGARPRMRFNASKSMGREMCRSKPASDARSRSAVVSCGVSAMSKVILNLASLRNSLAAM